MQARDILISVLHVRHRNSNQAPLIRLCPEAISWPIYLGQYWTSVRGPFGVCTRVPASRTTTASYQKRVLSRLVAELNGRPSVKIDF